MATFGLPRWPWAGCDPADLPDPERLVLDAGRAWVGAARDGRPMREAARQVLLTEDVGEAARGLDGVLRATALVGQAGWGCRHCPAVTEAETASLLAISLCQAGARHEALAALLRWLPPAGAYPAMAAMIPLAATLRGAGLVLTDPFRAAVRRR